MPRGNSRFFHRFVTAWSLHLSSLMIAWRIKYAVLWDNNPAGRAARTDATHFGEHGSRGTFSSSTLALRNVPIIRFSKTYLTGQPLLLSGMRFVFPPDASFDKTIAGWFYSRDHEKITRGLKGETEKDSKNYWILFT